MHKVELSLLRRDVLKRQNQRLLVLVKVRLCLYFDDFVPLKEVVVVECLAGYVKTGEGVP
jgi:hypothetical protein